MTDASNVPLIPREVLFGNPEKMAPGLSPTENAWPTWRRKTAS